MKKLISLLLALALVLSVPMQAQAVTTTTKFEKDNEFLFPTISVGSNTVTTEKPKSVDAWQICMFICSKTGKYTFQLTGIRAADPYLLPKVEVEFRKMRKGDTYDKSKRVKGPKNSKGDELTVSLTSGRWFSLNEESEQLITRAVESGFMPTYKKTMNLKKGDVILICVDRPGLMSEDSKAYTRFDDKVTFDVNIKKKK